MLVVDDELAILPVVESNHVATASGGLEAIEGYTRVHPDLVLLDLGAMGCNG